MSVFTESLGVLVEINYKPESNTVETKKEDRVFKDGILISTSAPIRKAYAQSQKDEFIAEIEGGAEFATSYGW